MEPLPGDISPARPGSAGSEAQATAKVGCSPPPENTKLSDVASEGSGTGRSGPWAAYSLGPELLLSHKPSGCIVTTASLGRQLPLPRHRQLTSAVQGRTASGW